MPEPVSVSLIPVRAPTQIGPGVRDHHKRIGRRVYRPNGPREVARRLRQMARRAARAEG